MVFSRSEGRGQRGVADWRCEWRHIQKKMSVLNQQLTPEVSCGQVPDGPGCPIPCPTQSSSAIPGKVRAPAGFEPDHKHHHRHLAVIEVPGAPSSLSRVPTNSHLAPPDCGRGRQAACLCDKEAMCQQASSSRSKRG